MMIEDSKFQCLFEKLSSYAKHSQKYTEKTTTQKTGRSTHKEELQRKVNTSYNYSASSLSELFEQKKKRNKFQKWSKTLRCINKTGSTIRSYYSGHTESRQNSSMLNINTNHSKSFEIKRLHSSKDIRIDKTKPYGKHFIVNYCCRNCDNPECHEPITSPIQATIYQCQSAKQNNSCCCNCNSDAMVQVLKSVYDCFKKKNCANCDCILCGLMPAEERARPARDRKAEREKRREEKAARKRDKEAKAIAATKAKAAAAIKCKTFEEKKRILQRLASSGKPLPDGETDSEKKLIEQIKSCMWLKRCVKNVPSKELGPGEAERQQSPLDGKTSAEKMKILQDLVKVGKPLPEGKTALEKILIDKIRRENITPPKLKKSYEEIKLPVSKTCDNETNTDEVDCAIEPDFCTCLEQKKRAKSKRECKNIPNNNSITSNQLIIQSENFEDSLTASKERIIRELTAAGLPLVKTTTSSEKELMEKVRKDLGLPPEPKTSAEWEKFNELMTAGILQPLYGKTLEEKEIILRNLAMHGIPLPEGSYPSEKKLIDKVRVKIGLPPAPKTAQEKAKYNRAFAAGIISPLEGKTTKQKETILKALAKKGLALPEGRDSQEKAIIKKIQTDISLCHRHAKEINSDCPARHSTEQKRDRREKETVIVEGHEPFNKYFSDVSTQYSAKRVPDKLLAEKLKIPMEKLCEAAADGLLAPLDGKSCAEKEYIIRGLANLGLPMPTPTSKVDKTLIDKVIVELGLPPRPKSNSEKMNYMRMYASGAIEPLEGKTPEEKEEMLRRLYGAGLSLPVPRTASEKALMDKIKSTVKKGSTKKSKGGKGGDEDEEYETDELGNRTHKPGTGKGGKGHEDDYEPDEFGNRTKKRRKGKGGKDAGDEYETDEFGKRTKTGRKGKGAKADDDEYGTDEFGKRTKKHKSKGGKYDDDDRETDEYGKHTKKRKGKGGKYDEYETDESDKRTKKHRKGKGGRDDDADEYETDDSGRRTKKHRKGKGGKYEGDDEYETEDSGKRTKKRRKGKGGRDDDADEYETDDSGRRNKKHRKGKGGKDYDDDEYVTDKFGNRTKKPRKGKGKGDTDEDNYEIDKFGKRTKKRRQGKGGKDDDDYQTDALGRPIKKLKKGKSKDKDTDTTVDADPSLAKGKKKGKKGKYDTGDEDEGGPLGGGGGGGKRGKGKKGASGKGQGRDPLGGGLAFPSHKDARTGTGFGAGAAKRTGTKTGRCNDNCRCRPVVKGADLCKDNCNCFPVPVELMKSIRYVQVDIGLQVDKSKSQDIEISPDQYNTCKYSELATQISEREHLTIDPDNTDPETSVKSLVDFQSNINKTPSLSAYSISISDCSPSHIVKSNFDSGIILCRSESTVLSPASSKNEIVTIRVLPLSDSCSSQSSEINSYEYHVLRMENNMTTFNQRNNGQQADSQTLKICKCCSKQPQYKTVTIEYGHRERKADGNGNKAKNNKNKKNKIKKQTATILVKDQPNKDLEIVLTDSRSSVYLEFSSDDSSEGQTKQLNCGVDQATSDSNTFPNQDGYPSRAIDTCCDQPFCCLNKYKTKQGQNQTCGDDGKDLITIHRNQNPIRESSQKYSLPGSRSKVHDQATNHNQWDFENTRKLREAIDELTRFVKQCNELYGGSPSGSNASLLNDASFNDSQCWGPSANSLKSENPSTVKDNRDKRLKLNKGQTSAPGLKFYIKPRIHCCTLSDEDSVYCALLSSEQSLLSSESSPCQNIKGLFCKNFGASPMIEPGGYPPIVSESGRCPTTLSKQLPIPPSAEVLIADPIDYDTFYDKEKKKVHLKRTVSHAAQCRFSSRSKNKQKTLKCSYKEPKRCALPIPQSIYPKDYTKPNALSASVSKPSCIWIQYV